MLDLVGGMACDEYLDPEVYTQDMMSSGRRKSTMYAPSAKTSISGFSHSLDGCRNHMVAPAENSYRMHRFI